MNCYLSAEYDDLVIFNNAFLYLVTSATELFQVDKRKDINEKYLRMTAFYVRTKISIVAIYSIDVNTSFHVIYVTVILSLSQQVIFSVISTPDKVFLGLVFTESARQNCHKYCKTAYDEDR